MKASGAGAPGTVDADVVVRLAPRAPAAPSSPTTPTPSVGGVIGGVGQRMLAGVTKKMAGQFFSAVDADIAGVRVRRPERSRGRHADGGTRHTQRGACARVVAGAAGPRAPFAGRDFALGVVTGGAVALVGVVVGWAIGGGLTMRAFTAAAVQVAPVPAPLTAETIARQPRHVRRDDPRVRRGHRCRARRAARDRRRPASPRAAPRRSSGTSSPSCPGAMIEPIQAVARELGVHVCFGTYERGPERGVVYNSSVLIGPSGDLLGVYRKTHPFCSEIVAGGGWVTPGDTVTVCDTELGRIGMIICFDGDYPELSRIQAVQGAEVICRPSALLRSADIWDLTSRARAYDNHVYVIGANAVGVDPAGVLYFGNSHIVTPIGHIVAKAATHEGWVSARLDPADGASSLTPGLEHRPGLRPPARPQPRPHPQPPRRARGRRRDVVPARPDPPGRRRADPDPRRPTTVGRRGASITACRPACRS